jgi:hypothetical protein
VEDVPKGNQHPGRYPVDGEDIEYLIRGRTQEYLAPRAAEIEVWTRVLEFVIIV